MSDQNQPSADQLAAMHQMWALASVYVAAEIRSDPEALRAYVKDAQPFRTRAQELAGIAADLMRSPALGNPQDSLRP